jgi:hypothetical protein
MLPAECCFLVRHGSASSFPPFYQTLDIAPDLNQAKLIEFSKTLLRESIAK